MIFVFSWTGCKGELRRACAAAQSRSRLLPPPHSLLYLCNSFVNNRLCIILGQGFFPIFSYMCLGLFCE